jgi:quinol monooxygenase YgiN
MWLNCSRTRVKPENVHQLVEVLAGEASLRPIQAAQGFRGLYLVESAEIPGEVVSISIWESAGDGQAYLASPACQRVVAGIQAYLCRPLERQYYEVLLAAEARRERLSG